MNIQSTEINVFPGECAQAGARGVDDSHRITADWGRRPSAARGGGALSTVEHCRPYRYVPVPQDMTVWVFPVIIPHIKQASSLATAVFALLAHFLL